MQQNYSKKTDPIQKASKNTASSVLDASSQSEALQRKADMANNAAQRAEAPRPNNTGMPDNLKAGIESLSGFSMDDVRVHYNSSKPATVQALAYTQGTDIHVAPGQEKHLPHEAWHVAQQMAGRVSPTTNINGMPVNDNAGLEHEADVMGERAVQCKMVGEKSLESKENYDNVIQCLNHQAFFKTENDEGCPYSRYYIFPNRYVRIAPINTRRSPTQEYHEGERNFVYFKDDTGCKILKRYHSDKSPIMKEIEEWPIEKEFKLDGQIFSKKPQYKWCPFDWYGNSRHPGHKITNVTLGLPRLPSSETLDKYRARNKYAIEFAFNHFSENTDLKEDWSEYSATCKQPNKEGFIRWVILTYKLTTDSRIRQAIDHARHTMDDYFWNLWNRAVKSAEAEGRRLFSRKIFDQLVAQKSRKQRHNLRNDAEELAEAEGRRLFSRSKFDQLAKTDPIASEYFTHLPKLTSGSGPGVIASSSGMKRGNSAGTTEGSSTKRNRTH